MSIKRMVAVWEHSQASRNALLLLLALSDNADDDGYCWPGIEYLAHKIRMTPQSVINLTARLEELGELHVLHNRRYGNKYLVTTGFTTEAEFMPGLLKMGYSEEEAEALTKKLLHQRGFSSDVKDNLSSEVKEVLEEPSKNPQGTVNNAPEAPNSSSQPESEDTDQLFDELFGPAPNPPGDHKSALDLRTPEGRERIAARIAEARNDSEPPPWRDLERRSRTLATYNPPAPIDRAAVLSFIYELTRLGIPLDLERKSEVRFWLNETESLLRKAGYQPLIMSEALQKALQDGISIKSPKSVAYALADVLRARESLNLGPVSGGGGGPVTPIQKVQVRTTKPPEGD